jgi:hypothetical protein
MATPEHKLPWRWSGWSCVIALELEDEINLMLIDRVSYYLMHIIVMIVMS